MIIKLGESVFIRPEDIKPIEKLANDMGWIEDRMYKFAQELRVIAPKAKDFLYFTCVMMHAAEAACVNDDGSPKKTSHGQDVSATWETTKEGGVKWTCNEKSLMPYRNNNRDIFPEAELKVAYKNWVGRPLCLDHQSQSVDKIRGVIVDTVYDERRKRVIALCALDAKNYGDLADKVKTGVANNVSMGTAVGRAVCSDCHRDARTEKDFCQHRKNKSCYGEINLDLTPIELSLVVSGADPKAKVKHIIASDIAKAAGLLSDYLEVKKGLSRQDLTSIKKDLQSLMGKIESMANDFDENDEGDAVGPTRSTWSMEESSVEPSTQINPPEAFPTYASDLQKAILGAQTKLASLQENLLRLSNSNEEPTMTTNKNAYYQGTEEPTPGKAQYQVDPLHDKTRLMDKNLHGPAPFPNTGNETELFPGDEKIKKELQRIADEHERALFREAALKKAKEQLQSKGYYLGTEEQTPGKVKYTKDPLNEKDRMLDKQMVGEKPFPGVGDIEGLYNDDEKEKEKLLRASLVKARFEKVALPDGRVNKAASSWVVYANDKAILRASVDQITKGNSESLYDAVATERFGKSLLNRIQTEGFQATADALLKSAQAAPSAPPPAPAADGGADLPPLEPPKDVGGKGGDTDTIVQDLQSLFDEMGGKLSDLRDKVSGAVSEDADAMPDVEPAGDAEFAEGPKTASQLQSMRKRVNGMLQEGVDETITSLAKHMREIGTAKRVYKEAYASMTTEQREYLNELTISAVKDARSMLVDAGKLMEAVVKYAYGTAELEKRASNKDPEKDLLDAIFASEETEETADAADGEEETADAKDGAEEECADAADGEEETADAEDGAEEECADAATGELPDADEGAAEDGAGTFDSWLANIKGKGASDKADAKLSLKAPDGTAQQLGEVTVTAGGTLELSTKEGRAQARIKLAEKGLLGFNELSNDAHPGGSVSVVDAANLDVKPSTPGAEFHVQKDLQSYMLELANMPPRVRKQAEMIQALVAEGKMKADDVDKLVSHGVDADAVKYWKELFGQGDSESKEFASKLTQEHAKAKQAEEVESYKGRIKRAYEVANQMLAKGMITEAQLDSQVNDIMKWNDAGFESIKNILARQPSMTRQASIPMVGLLSSGEVILPMAKTASSQGETDIKGFFDNYFESKGLKF